jgi:hypothetical protein
MPETTELMQRPHKQDDLVIKRTLELFMPKVILYLSDDWHESERESVKEQISDVLRENSDGYDMARELESRHHWEQDRTLVDLMDEGEIYQRQAHKELLKQWIEVYEIQPSRKIGDRVSTTNWHRKGQVGEITKIYEDRAEYAVRFSDQPLTSAQLLEYEEVIDGPEVTNADNTERMGESTGASDAPQPSGVH